MNHDAPTLVWFRQDLRIADNPALAYASQKAAPVIPIFLWTPQEEGQWNYGEASQWWLHHSLTQLKKVIKQHYDLDLVIRKGESSLELLQELVAETQAASLYWNRRYEPDIIARDKNIKSTLAQQGVEIKSFNALLLVEPWEVSTQAGKPYQVFTPFWKTLQALPPLAQPEVAPCRIKKWNKKLSSLALKDLQLEPKLNWAEDFKKEWIPGEAGAKKKWQTFLAEAWKGYLEGRNQPAQSLTSRLSPHLHFGEISPRALWHGLQKKIRQATSAEAKKNALGYLRELAWREFAYHLLYYFSQTPTQPLREKYKNFHWSQDEGLLQAWQKGKTGYPLVDAGMRELWTTGWMHNRVRMIVASFLIKDLFIPWQKGAEWFWDTLVDADLANNTLGWQWVAGCGADAAPYFRVFNPRSQAKKFDPDGIYIKKWVPELARLSIKYLFEPWKAPPQVLEEAGIVLGRDYPEPIIDHAWARERALMEFKRIK